MYCFDPRHFRSTTYDQHNTGIFRAQFMIEAVSNLRKKLKEVGSELIVTLDEPEIALPRLLAGKPGANVIIEGEVGHEEVKVERKLAEISSGSGATFHKVIGGQYLYHPEDVPFDDLSRVPDVFTPFKETVEKKSRGIRKEQPVLRTGQLGSPPDLSSIFTDKCSFTYMPNLKSLGFEPAELEGAMQVSR